MRNLRQQEIQKQSSNNNSDIALIFTQICAYVKQLKTFSMDTEYGDTDQLQH